MCSSTPSLPKATNTFANCRELSTVLTDTWQDGGGSSGNLCAYQIHMPKI